MEETPAPQEFKIKVVGATVSPDGSKIQYYVGLFEMESDAQLVHQLSDGTQIPVVFGSIPINIVPQSKIIRPDFRVLN